MGGSSSLPSEPLYVSACACGKVEVELRGEPLYTFHCYCQDCTAAAHYAMEQAEANGHKNIPPWRDGEKAPKASLFYLAHAKVTKGQDNMEIFKCSPNTMVTRSYTKCCSTQIMNAAGNWPVDFRPFMFHTLKDAKTGQPPAWTGPKIMCKNANKEHLHAAPKSGPELQITSWTMIWMWVSGFFFRSLKPGLGEMARKPVAWINGSSKEVPVVMPFVAYHKTGHKLDKPIPLPKKSE